MKIALHPGAERDLVEAAAFYESEASPALAARFIAEFERVVRLIAANPDTVVYREVPEGILVLVVKHDRRRPGFGASRA